MNPGRGNLVNGESGGRPTVIVRLLVNAAGTIIVTAGVLALLVAVGRKYVPPYQPPVELAGDMEASYRRIADAVSEEALKAEIEGLCPDGSRLIGTPGYERAVDHIRLRFERAGLQDVIVLRYPVTMPLTKVARLEVIGEAEVIAQAEEEGGRFGRPKTVASRPATTDGIQIYPLWPNVVRTCTVPPEGLTGRLVDAGDGELRRFNGNDVNGAIVLLNADCDRRWLNVPLLGGAAVVLCGSEKFTRAQAEQKSLTTPVNVPRFFVNEADGNRLRRLAAAGGTLVRISCRVHLEDVQAATVCGILPGSDPQFSREALVLDAYFDSISQVPDLAPGAEASCGMAALLQAAELFGRERPRRTILFVANGGHFVGKGFERLLHVLGRRVPNQDTSIMVRKQIADYGARLAELAARLERCERESRLIELGGEGQTGPREWAGADEDVRKQIVHDIQMSIKAVLDDAFEAARKSGAGKDASMPRARRLALQRMCWESSLAKLCTESWGEVRDVLPRLRMRVERRRADLTGEIERLRGERRFLQSIAKLNLKLFLGLDLSTATRSFGMYERGNLDTPPYEGRGPVQPLADRMMSFAEKMEEVVYGERPGDDADAGESAMPRFVHSFKTIKNVPPRSYVVAMMKFDVDACYYGPNWTAATFCTLNDSRRYTDTPYDTIERMEIGNLAEQVRLMLPMLKVLLDDAATLAGESDLHDHAGTVTLQAMTVPRGGAIVPDHPMEGAIIVDKATDHVRNHWYFNVQPFACGVRENQFAVAGENGTVTFPMQWHEVFTAAPKPFEAYKLDPETGEIICAVDRGVSGAERFPAEVILDRPHKEGTLVLFRCQPVALFDLIDQRYMTLLRQIDVIGAEEDSTPLSYGYTLSTMPAGLHETETAGESCAMVYVEPGKRFKATMSAGLMGLRLALLNMPEVEGRDAAAIREMEQESGMGYLPDATARLPLTPWLVARDMWRLDEIRIRSLSSRGIRNELLESLHNEAGAWKRAAEDAFDRRDYAAAMAAAHEAWACESRAYPLVRSAADDAIKGVIFYLFLLLPFSFFGERLLFGFPKIVHRIFGMAGIFVVVFATLRLTHPAFKLTTSPAMVLLAFVTLALAVLVIALLGGKVAEQLRKLRQREEARSIDVNRLSSLRTAFVLGISNLRKRPIRSGLTAVTLILMSFTVVSFTSVRFVPRYNKIDTNQDAPYDGILVKRPQWAALDPDVYQSLQVLYGSEEERERVGDGGSGRGGDGEKGRGGECAVVPRGWYAGEVQVSVPGRPVPVVNVAPTPADAAIDATINDDSQPLAEPEHAWPTVKSVTGLDPREPVVTGIDKLLVAGRWLSAADANECVVPTEVAEKLMLTGDDVGQVSVYVLGRELRVAGLIDGKGLASLLDLNGEPLVPIDYTFVQTTAKAKQETESDRYRHFMPEETVIVPFETLREFGRSYAGRFSIASVAVAMDRQRAEMADREGMIRRYMASKAVNLYVGIGGRSYFYNVPGMLSFSGLRSVLMPLAIAFLIVLNTMMGAVYERFRDIYIFSSIGLAPSHIASLFLAESCVFATIGGVLGYLLGQVLSVAAARMGVLSGLTLNYSSSSVVMAMLLVMGVVVASTLYPAHKASRLASPSTERTWSLPASMGDELRLTLPFMVEERDAAGLMAFIGQYLGAHREAGVGKFIAGAIGYGRAEEGRTQGSPLRDEGGRIQGSPPRDEGGRTQGSPLRVEAEIWMAPYDLGVSQGLVLMAGQADADGVCGLSLELVRKSGEPRSWQRTNFIFLDSLRKQFLRWRTVPPGRREEYAREWGIAIGQLDG